LWPCTALARVTDIEVHKFVNGIEALSPPGPLVSVGSTVIFTYAVTNPGEEALSGVRVRDDNGTPLNSVDDFLATFVGGDSNTNGLLDLTETFTFTASRIATLGLYTNFATAEGFGAETEDVVTAMAIANHTGVSSAPSVAEPSTLLLLGSGLAALAARGRRRSQTDTAPLR
jgi:hypothetical protein